MFITWLRKKFGPGSSWIWEKSNVITGDPSTRDLDYLNNLTKEKLELLGRSYGVELDRRKRKDTLVKELVEIITKHEANK